MLGAFLVDSALPSFRHGPVTSAEILLCVIVGVLGAIASLFHRIRTSRDAISDEPADVDVTVLRFGLDGRTRRFVEAELERAATIRGIALVLRRVRDAWIYGGARNFPTTTKDQAQASFQQHVAAARALHSPSRSPGLALLTIVVAAKRELFTVTRIGDGDELRQALEVLSALTSDTLVAFEVIWTPTATEDLAQLLPGGVFPIPGAMDGMLACRDCGGPFPGALRSCPHCGGRVD